jgi:hypothetical protein
VLAVSVAVTALLYVVPYGRTLAWPLVLVSTLAHELAHGLAALVLGGRFESLQIHADASGVALWSGGLGRLATASVAAAGLLGPAVAAFLLLAVGRRERGARTLLIVLGVALCIVALVLVRSAFGFSFTLLLGAALLFIGVRFPRAAQPAIILLAVQLALSVFSRGDYLFTPMVLTAYGPMPSDVGVMAAALVLPFWFWGAVCGALSVALLAAGVRVFFRR